MLKQNLSIYFLEKNNRLYETSVFMSDFANYYLAKAQQN